MNHNPGEGFSQKCIVTEIKDKIETTVLSSSKQQTVETVTVCHSGHVIQICKQVHAAIPLYFHKL